MRTRTKLTIIRKIQKGFSLRAIGNQYGLDSKTVWRIGASVGVFSVRSKRNCGVN